MIGENEQREILDFNHEPHITQREDYVYEIEGQLTDFFKTKNAVTALSLSIMLSRNPKETDKWQDLKDIFTKADQERELNEKIKSSEEKAA